MSEELRNGKFVDFLGSVRWYKNGAEHREDGPAVEHTDGSKEWFLNGERHRDDGPAIEDGDGTVIWFLHDVQVTEEEFNHWQEKKKLNKRLHSTLEERPVQKKCKI